MKFRNASHLGPTEQAPNKGADAHRLPTAPGIEVRTARQPWPDVDCQLHKPGGLAASEWVSTAPTTAETAPVAGDPPNVHAPDRDIERSPANPTTARVNSPRASTRATSAWSPRSAEPGTATRPVITPSGDTHPTDTEYTTVNYARLPACYPLLGLSFSSIEGSWLVS